MTTPDKLCYVRIPKGQGGRAELVRLAYVLAGKPYIDVVVPFGEAQATVRGKNPFKQFPFVELPSGEVLYQTLAILHHVTQGTSAWPDDPARLTRALAVFMGGYDLYQAFGGFPAGDLVAKGKFEQRKVPQFFDALDAIYAESPFAAGDTATFADCMVREAVDWCARRNEVARARLEASPHLSGFLARFDALPAVRAFQERQAAARLLDDAV